MHRQQRPCKAALPQSSKGEHRCVNSVPAKSSPRQISECYRMVGRKVGITDTQNARLYKEVRDRLDAVLKPRGLAFVRMELDGIWHDSRL